MRSTIGGFAVCGLMFFILPSPAASPLAPLGTIDIQGGMLEPEDVSAVVKLGQLLVIGSDETRAIQVLVPVGTDAYRAEPPVRLMSGEADQTEEEFDIEAMALHGSTLYVTGSHCSTRGKVGGKKASHAKNLRELAEVKRRPERERLFRVELDPSSGRPTRVECKSLHDVINDDPVLQRFVAVPSKENGVDIEGLAVDPSGTLLYVGFRGPVLQGEFVPVLRLPFEHLKQYEMLFLKLDGYGIRELTCVEGGFLVIAGPAGEMEVPGRLYFWDGKDCLPDKKQASKPVLLAEIPGPGKPEGLAVLREDSSVWEVIVAYDGVPNGGMRRFRVAKP
jgi:hypothetical protein